MITITQEFETKEEAKMSLNAINYWTSLYELDEWLRQELKHGSHESAALYDQMEMIREKITITMDRNGVNLLEQF